MALGVVQPSTTSNPPGTEFLVDNTQTAELHPSEHANFKHAGKKKEDIVLIPQPSNNPNDPLLWPRWRKEIAFAVLFANNIFLASCPGPLIAPATIALSKVLHVSVKQVSQLSGYQLLIVGAIGPFVSVLAQKHGKRPQFLFASTMGAIGTGICIAGFKQTDYDLILAGRLVQGLGTTAYESLSVAAIGDIFYLHERGLRTALLVLTLACLSSFVSIIAGVLFQNHGPNATFIALLPFQLAGWVGTVFFLPETQFKRVSDSTATSTSATHEKDGHTVTENTTNGADVPAKRTFVQDLRPFSGVMYTEQGILKLLLEIFIHLLNPAVIWIQLVSAVLVSFFVGAAYTIAQIFSAPPYFNNVEENGFFFTGALVGGIIGISAGPICDWSARFMARRNRGIYEAEFRIPVIIIAALAFGIGWFVFMWEMQHKGRGGVVLASFCYGLVCFGTSVASTSGGLYILDAFRKYSTQIFILQMMIKNFLFYAFSAFINDWVAEKGAAEMCKVFGIVTLAGFTTCVPMYIFGKVNRVWVHRIWTRYLDRE